MDRPSGGNAKQPAIMLTAVILNGWRGRRVRVVGESFYIDEIRAAVSGLERVDDVYETTAALVIEHDNPEDENAVGVYLEGASLCGHLSRADAEAYRPLLERLARIERIGACRAIIGGGTEEKPNYGIFLDLAPPESALPEGY